MKTHSLKPQNILGRLTRLPKLLLTAGIAALLAAPQVDARPDRYRDRGGDRHSGYSRHHGHGHAHARGYHRPQYHRPHYPVRRGWVRPGFYGAYPPAGYVDYRYIRSLPRGYRTVYRGGHRYYYANGCYYWPARHNNHGVYLSVRF